MSNKTRFENKDKKVGRKKYLKGLVAGFLGAAAFLKLTDIPRVNAAPIEGAGSSGEIAYFTSLAYIASSSHLRWDSSAFSARADNFIGGHEDNEVTAGVVGATISGGGKSGEVNKVTDNYGTIGGGMGNQAGDDAGDHYDKKHATVGGGYSNTASGKYSTVSGGWSNTGSGLDSTVCGGVGNTASGIKSTVGGGQLNVASDSYSTVGGGYDNTASKLYSTVGGGYDNTASSFYSTVGGGYQNTASGYSSTVGGGHSNAAAGNHSFAAGRKANASHNGAFLFADENDHYFHSATDNEFAIRCTGGARFVTKIDGSGTPTRQVSILTDGRVYANTSPDNSLYPTIESITASTKTGVCGVFGLHNASSGQCYGVKGMSNSSSGAGVYGVTVNGVGVLAEKTGSGWALSVKGKSKFGGSVIPTLDNKYKLGYGAKRWKAVHAVDFLTTSLSKFKENIEQPSDIDYLTSVPEPIYFNWRDSDDKEKRLGFMGDYLPEIARDDDGGIYTSSVTAILCGAIKQLKEENEELRKRIERLEENN